MKQANRTGCWVYFFGTLDGEFVKIGQTTRPLAARRDELERGVTARTPLALLAAVRGTTTIEKTLHSHFARSRHDAGGGKETYRADAELTEYVNWLRHEWFVTLDENEPQDECEVDWDRWCPGDGRRVAPPPTDDEQLFNVQHTYIGDLAGTAWSWMATPTPVGNDYYTPPDLIGAARSAMGFIDLDPASHWRANKEHKIPVFYDLNRRAEQNPWFGRVWLNPPYGDNKKWFDLILEHFDAIDQLCMLSPVWAFTTGAAKPFMDKAAASVLLTPTPAFWGHPMGRTGTNHPHMVVYVGPHAERFVEAFRPHGIPVALL